MHDSLNKAADTGVLSPSVMTQITLGVLTIALIELCILSGIKCTQWCQERQIRKTRKRRQRALVRQSSSGSNFGADVPCPTEVEEKAEEYN